VVATEKTYAPTALPIAHIGLFLCKQPQMIVTLGVILPGEVEGRVVGDEESLPNLLGLIVLVDDSETPLLHPSTLVPRNKYSVEGTVP